MATEILTIKQVADYLQLDAATVYRMAQTKRIPASKVGRVWRFRKDLIDAWLQEQTESRGVDSLRVF